MPLSPDEVEEGKRLLAEVIPSDVGGFAVRVGADEIARFRGLASNAQDFANGYNAALVAAQAREAMVRDANEDLRVALVVAQEREGELREFAEWVVKNARFYGLDGREGGFVDRANRALHFEDHS